jgi:hypothetical protein
MATTICKLIHSQVQASALTRALDEQTLELQSSKAAEASLAEEKVNTQQALSLAEEGLAQLKTKLESSYLRLVDAEKRHREEIGAVRAEGQRQVEEAVAASLKLSETHHTATLLQLRDELRWEASSERDRLLDKCTLVRYACVCVCVLCASVYECEHVCVCVCVCVCVSVSV